ncbi:hypothetical protein SESBI_20982 [Sesbania bispinosa]|nr:hypothetical protein SESBI_20982 [Sesbania bispinosa]
MAAPKSNHPPAATANANNGKVGEQSGEKDLHGDWMLVSRNKRSQKSRPLKNGNNDERRPKLLTRKKRPRREHIPILPTIVSNDKYKARVDRSKTIESSKENDVGSKAPKSIEKPTHPLVKSTHLANKGAGPSFSPKQNATLPSGLKGDTTASNMKSARDNPKLACEIVCNATPMPKSLPFGINTTMQVEVISPNHLRMLDENDPPDPGQLSGMLVEGNEEPIGRQSEVDMDKSTSDEDEEVDMVGETQYVHG